MGAVSLHNPWVQIYLLYLVALLVALLYDFLRRPGPRGGSPRIPEGTNASTEEPPAER